MSSKKLIFLILLLMIGMAGQVFADATITPIPTNVPKGAYVNGPLGAADDNFFWQSVTITTTVAHATGTITLTLPTGMTIADVDNADGGGGASVYDEEVSISWQENLAGTEDLTLVATTTSANAVILTMGGATGIEIGDVITVMFPVETSLSPAYDTDDYYLEFSITPGTDDVADGDGPDITFVDPAPNAIVEVTFAAALMKDAATGYYDSTLADGEIYPAVTIAAYTAALPDYITDGDATVAGTGVVLAVNLPADVATTFLGTAGAVNTEDTYFRIYASTDPTLSHINNDDTGVILLRNHTVAGALPFNTYDYSHEAHTGAQGFTVANLPEGDWYIYVVNSLTGDFPLGRSDKLTVTHFPQVDVLAWDFDAGLTIDGGTPGLESGVWNGDSEDMTLDTGLFYAPEGAIIPTATYPSPADDVDLYISVDDFDDDAVVTLFYSATSNLDTSLVDTSGSTSPDRVVIGLTGATLIVDNLEENLEDEDGFLVYNWIIDTNVPAGAYTLYAVTTDGKNLHVKPLMGFNTGLAPTYSGATQLTMNIKHSPDLILDSLDEYNLGTDTNGDGDVTIDQAQTDIIMISWGKAGVDGDKDFDDSCTIEFYIDWQGGAAPANKTPEFGSDEAGAIRTAAALAVSSTGTHKIKVDLVEDLEGKKDSYYAWNLKEDWLATGWEPLDQSGVDEQYHLYGIITEGSEAGDTERVVCLGITGVFDGTVASTPTTITFDNADGYAKLVDPPVEGVTIGSSDTYRMNFEAFDIDADQEVGIFIVKEVAGELVANGDFEAGVGTWVEGAEWTISNGEANFVSTGATSTLIQPLPLLVAGNYTVTFEIKNFTGTGTITPTLGVGVGTSRSTNGVFTETIASGGVGNIIFTPTAGAFSCSIDNVSVRAGIGAYTDGVLVTTIADISGLLDGDAYALTSTDGTLANGVWLLDNTATDYDASLQIPGVVPIKYLFNLNGGVDLVDGNYWVYIGINPDTAGNPDFGVGTTPLYRGPGLLTISGIGGGNPQQNLSMEPRSFVSTVGDIDTISVRAYSAVPVDIIDIYISVDQDYFDLDDESTPFIDVGFTDATMVENEAIDDVANSRWVLHATLSNNGDDIGPTTGGIGVELLKFTVIGKGTDTSGGVTTAFNYMNVPDPDPSKSFDTQFKNDGIVIPINSTPVNIDVRPRGIINGIVEFEAPDPLRVWGEIVTFRLRNRGSYEPSEDTSFISANDGVQADSTEKMDVALYAGEGIQYRLDENGYFTLYQVPEGAWELYVYYERYLAKTIDVDISAGLDNLLVDFEALFGGDCYGYTDVNNDEYPNNAINQDDVDRINNAYGSTPAAPRWDTETIPATGGKYNYKWADINEDDVVGVIDLTMATGNFTYGGSANLGAQPVYMKPVVGDIASNMDAFVEFMNVPVELKAGQTYTIQIVIDNAVNVKGYDVRMDYDHIALTFAGIEKGDFIKDESNSFSINSGGTIGLVNTVYGPTAYSGAGILAEVSFSANRNGIFTSDMLGISQALVVDNNYLAFDLFAADAPTGVGTAEVPVEFALTQNFPNPFNPTTMINFSIPMSSNVEIKVYNILGRHVRTLVSGNYEAGNYSVVWNATDLNGNLVSNGVYFYTIRAAGYSLTKKMLFMK